MSWREDPRLLAYALGEFEALSAADRSEVEQAIDGDAEARRVLDELRAFLPELEAAVVGVPSGGLGASESDASDDLRLSDTARDRIAQAARGEVEREHVLVPARPWTQRYAVPLAAAAAVMLAAVGTFLVSKAPTAVGDAAPAGASLRSPSMEVAGSSELADGEEAPQPQTFEGSEQRNERGLESGAALARDSKKRDDAPAAARSRSLGYAPPGAEAAVLESESTADDFAFAKEERATPLPDWRWSADARRRQSRRGRSAVDLDEARAKPSVASEAAGIEGPGVIRVQVARAPWRPDSRVVRIEVALAGERELTELVVDWNDAEVIEVVPLAGSATPLFEVVLRHPAAAGRALAEVGASWGGDADGTLRASCHEAAVEFADAPPELRFAAAVALFEGRAPGGTLAGRGTLDDVHRWASSALEQPALGRSASHPEEEDARKAFLKRVDEARRVESR